MSHSQPLPPNPNTFPAGLTQCDECLRYFKGNRGLKIHTGRIHKAESVPNTLCPGSSRDNRVSVVPLWKKLSLYKNNSPVVKRVPRGARVMVAEELKKNIDQVLHDNNVTSWEDLLSFAYRILHVDKQSNNSHSLTKKIKDNCKNDSNKTLLDDGVNYDKQQRPFNKVAKIEGKVSDGDLKGASQLLFSSDSLAPNNADTLLALKSKHPAPLTPVNVPPPQSSTTLPRVSLDDVLTTITSFKNG